MNTSVSQINEKLTCSKHSQPISMVMLDSQMPFSEILLCLQCIDERKTILNRLTSLKQAIEIINEQYPKLDQKQQQTKDQTMNILNQFKQRMSELKSQYISRMNSIIRITHEWINTIQQIGIEPEKRTLLQDLEYFHRQNFCKISFSGEIKNYNMCYFQKIETIYQQILVTKDYENCFEQLANFELLKKQQQEILIQKQAQDEYKKKQQKLVNPNLNYDLMPIRFELINQVKQENAVYSLSFNTQGTLLITGSNSFIQILEFNEGRMTERHRLKGHYKITCLQFNNKCNQFISGDQDGNLLCWKEREKQNLFGFKSQEWITSGPFIQHTGQITDMKFSKLEDEFISCSQDGSIQIWKINVECNFLQDYYSLSQPKSNLPVGNLSLNEQGNLLISFYDQQIIVWVKNQNQKWQYQSLVKTTNAGGGVHFLSDNLFTWQEQFQTFINVYQVDNEKVEIQPNLQINLNKITTSKDQSKFLTFINSEKSILIWKYDRVIYFLKKQCNGQYKIAGDPINCENPGNIGAFSKNGRFLVIQDGLTFKIFRITYDQEQYMIL